MIGILAHGTLRCLGSPQHLRSTHGEGFRLTLTFHHHDADSVDGFVSSRFPVRSSRIIVSSLVCDEGRFV